MFQTKFDRWLIEHFVYEHHIKVVSLPERLPRNVKVKELNSQQYHHLLIAKNQKTAEKLIKQLKHNGAIFSTRVTDGNHWYNSLINNKRKSFTFRVFWWIISLSIAIIVIHQISLFLKSDLFFELKEGLNQLLGNS